ncbi:MAG: hypothetical protein H8D67_20050 [Deltaproteobacteria bacterium]|nr:hypothetical protein [Deltaproteobacteria bacterium]MBL7205148.1 hypothetical protein [Desulfobacteraceae bacterium]
MSEKAKEIREKMKTVRFAPYILGSVLSDLDYMDDFKRFTLDAIEKEKEKIEDRFERDTKNMSEEEKERYSEWAAEDYAVVRDLFSMISLNSFIIILYSNIESGLNRLCNVMFSDQSRLDEVQGKDPVKIRYVDMDGKGINRAKLYLEKVFNVNLHAGDQQWAEIDALKKIRNIIVHDDGWASNEMAKNSNIKTCRKNGFLEIEEKRDGTLGKLIVKPEYLTWILKHVRDFFSKIDLNI